ncbi:GLUG motif-containing protein [Paenibacillus piri]|nr:GLUG motif-containing protein [Paenibacillus piri]
MIRKIMKSFPKAFATLTALTMIFAAAPPSQTFAAPVAPSGSGTVSDPYVLVSKEHIEWLSNKVNKGDVSVNAKLGSDIDAAGLKHDPIGTSEHPFNGLFDGRGYRISNLKIDKSSSNNVGFFGYTDEDSVIKNLGLENATVLGASFTGALAGRSYGMIENCYTTGIVTAAYNSINVGGLAGNNHGTIDNSYSKANVKGSPTSDRVGGLVGQNAGTPDRTAEISYSSAEGAVSGSGKVGGLVGENCSFGSVTDSTASGEVSGRDFVGKLIGRIVPW